jgi:hypothetical protein
MKRGIEKKINLLVSKLQSVTVNIFEDIVQKECKNVSAEECFNLVSSMPRRLEAVIAAKGERIQY